MKIFHQSTFDKWPFDDNSIQAIITSPPFYGLRKYDIQDVIIGGNPEWEGSAIAEKIGLKCEHEWGDYKELNRQHHGKTSATMLDEAKITSSSSSCIHCNAWKGQYGLEPTYQLYIEHTLLWCQEAWRVLRDDGVFFLNLGDSYCSSGGPSRHKGYNDPKYPNGRNGEFDEPTAYPQGNIKPKCLLDIPFRVSIALVDNQGWIKRNNIPWYSPNKMPESVTDRFSKKHEMIFMMVKNPKYYFDLNAIRETVESHSRKGIKKPYNSKFNDSDEAKGQRTLSEYRQLCRSQGLPEGHPNGKNPGDVFIFNTQPSSEKHYACWPEKLVERMILCSTKAGNTVLDPFAGSGTTLRVADKLNREAFGIDLGYENIQKRRLSNIQKELIFNLNKDVKKL